MLTAKVADTDAHADADADADTLADAVADTGTAASTDAVTDTQPDAPHRPPPATRPPSGLDLLYAPRLICVPQAQPGVSSRSARTSRPITKPP